MRPEISKKNREEAYIVTGFPHSTTFDDVLAQLIFLVKNHDGEIDPISRS